jgi:hypothetical protein
VEIVSPVALGRSNTYKGYGYHPQRPVGVRQAVLIPLNRGMGLWQTAVRAPLRVQGLTRPIFGRTVLIAPRGLSTSPRFFVPPDRRGRPHAASRGSSVLTRLAVDSPIGRAIIILYMSRQ